VAITDIVVISEGSEEDVLRTPVLRKWPGKDNLFNFELKEDGTNGTAACQSLLALLAVVQGGGEALGGCAD